MSDTPTPEKFVLVIEDEAMIQQAIRDRFDRHDPDGWALLQAFTIPEARELIARHDDQIKIITFDYRVPGADGGLTTRLVQDLVEEGHDALLIAASSMNNHQLLAAGCADHCLKTELPKKLLDEMRYFDMNGYLRVMIREDLTLLRIEFRKDEKYTRSSIFQCPPRTGCIRLCRIKNPVVSIRGSDWYVLKNDPTTGLAIEGWDDKVKSGSCQILHSH